MFDPATAKPREVEAYLRESVRKIWNDSVENGALITSSHGYYNVEIFPDPYHFAFKNFRKSAAKKVVKAMRALV
jgi:hypothetical protein